MKGFERAILSVIAIICIGVLCSVVEKFAIPIEWGGDANTVSYKNTSSGMIVTELFSGRVLSENNADTPLEMASTTKIITAYLALKKGDFNKNVTITKEMCGIEGSSIYLKEGEIWTLEQLLYGVMLRSGNDAATAVAIATSGSVENFVSEMNEFAVKHGAKSTSFANPHGLHAENHYTTARELALLTGIAMRNPTFSKIAATKKISFTRPDGGAVTFANKNKFLQEFDGGCGVKTGYTKDAGRCLVSAARRNGMTLIGVVLNTPDMWNASANMLSRAFEKYALYEILGPKKVFPFEFRGKTLLGGARRRIFYPMTSEEFRTLSYEVSWLKTEDKILDLKKEVGEVSVSVQNQLLFSEKLYTILRIDELSLGNNKERLYENQQIFGGKRDCQPPRLRQAD